jgi:hypothetical protein
MSPIFMDDPAGTRRPGLEDAENRAGVGPFSMAGDERFEDFGFEKRCVGRDDKDVPVSVTGQFFTRGPKLRGRALAGLRSDDLRPGIGKPKS